MSLERILLAGFVTTGLAIDCRGLSKYEVHFQGTWTANSHPEEAVPSNPAFSELVGFTHRAGVDTFSVGNSPTAGLELLAEQGGTSTFINELDSIEGADELVGPAGGTANNGEFDFELEVNGEHNMATMMSMLSPSPDWFLMAQVDFCDHETGQWLETLEVNPPVYDAGTDAGILFESKNLQQRPKSERKITKFTRIRNVALLKFTRTGGCESTMDCEDSTVCAQGYCVPPCLSPDDCDGEVCDAGYCGGFVKEYYMSEGTCPSATRPLWSRDECESAAIQMRMPDTRASNVRDEAGLRGCYDVSGELYYNDRASVNNEGPLNANSICTNDGGNYVNVGSTGGCGVYNKIRNRDECAIAAGMLGLGTFRRASSTGSRSRPAGCFLRDNGRLYFNRRGDEDYAGTDAEAIICSY